MLDALREAFRGTIRTPRTRGYEDARRLFNRNIEARAAVLCRCADTGEWYGRCASPATPACLS
jgi:hypothetical protein